MPTPTQGVRRVRPMVTPPVGVTVLGIEPPGSPQTPAVAPPRFHDLPGEAYVAALCGAVAAEHRIPDPYLRPELAPMLEGRFLVDLPRLLRWMRSGHSDPSLDGDVAWVAILATLVDLAGT
jgi:hypothetical protein